MWCLERFVGDEQLRLYQSDVKYKGKIMTFWSREQAVEYLYAHSKEKDDRRVCPHCNFKYKPLFMHSRHLTHETNCKLCGKRFMLK